MLSVRSALMGRPGPQHSVWHLTRRDHGKEGMAHPNEGLIRRRLRLSGVATLTYCGIGTSPMASAGTLLGRSRLGDDYESTAQMVGFFGRVFELPANPSLTVRAVVALDLDPSG